MGGVVQAGVDRGAGGPTRRHAIEPERARRGVVHSTDHACVTAGDIGISAAISNKHPTGGAVVSAHRHVIAVCGALHPEQVVGATGQ